MAQFREQLQWLQTCRRVMSIPDYVIHLKAHGSTEGVAAITFDDGFSSFLTHALPVLEEMGLPATNYIPTGRVGTHNAWDSHLTQEVIPLMSWGQLRTLASNALVTLGTHGVGHVSLGWLDAQQVEQKISKAKEHFLEHLGREPEHFAFPYGQVMDMPKGAEAQLAEAGYLSACSTRFGRDSDLADLYRLRRITIEPGHTVADLERMTRGNWPMQRWRQAAKEALWSLRLRGKPAGRKPGT